MAVIKLFPRYFLIKDQHIRAVGEMPAKVVPSDEDDANAGPEDVDEEAAPREKKVPPRLQAKLTLIEELRAASVEGSADETVACRRRCRRRASLHASTRGRAARTSIVVR